MREAAERERLEQVFAEALEKPAAERERFLSELSAGEAELVGRVRAYLSALESRPRFLSAPPEVPLDALGEGPEAEPGSTAFLRPDEQVAGFRLTRVIGYGGMGVVYEATQSRPRRQIALKLLRATHAGPSAIRRFRTEAEVLGRMRHPGIAQVYEAGVATIESESVPYLAMELVAGARNLVEYAEERSLDLTARLRLFVDVARAVHHAHEQGVVHRDLKPANILVDTDGRIRIIDFGVARVVDGEVASSATTRTRGVLGTLAYMSPEQLGGEGGQVDARTDVYALGVVLYELIWGRAPHDFDARPLPEMIRAILETTIEPPRDGAAVDRDLETIVLEALRKTPGDRYVSAEAFASDVERYLAHEPIAARRPSTSYRVRMWARRRPSIVAAAVLVVLAVSTAAGVSGWFWIRGERMREAARTERVEAERAREELERVRGRLEAVVGEEERFAFEPFAESIVTTVTESLDRAMDDAERERLLTSAVETLRRLEPVVEAEPRLRRTMAEAYVDLGDAYGGEWEAGPKKVRGSVRAYERAVAIFQELGVARPEDVEAQRSIVRARIRLAQTLRKLRETERSREVAELALTEAEALDRSVGTREDTGLLIQTLWARSDALIGTDEAETALDDSRRAVELSEALIDRFPEETGPVKLGVWSEFRWAAWEYLVFDRPREALAHYRMANDYRLALARRDPGTPRAANDLLFYTQAEIELIERLRGPEPAARRLERFTDTALEAATAAGTELASVELLAERVRRLRELWLLAGADDRARRTTQELVSLVERLHEEHPADPRPVSVAEEIARWGGTIGENRTEAGR